MKYHNRANFAKNLALIRPDVEVRSAEKDRRANPRRRGARENAHRGKALSRAIRLRVPLDALVANNPSLKLARFLRVSVRAKRAVLPAGLPYILGCFEYLNRADQAYNDRTYHV